MSHVEARPLPTDWLVYGLVAIIVGCAISQQQVRQFSESYEFAGGRVMSNEKISNMRHVEEPVASTRAWPLPTTEYLRYPESQSRSGRGIINCTSTDSMATITRWYLHQHPEAVVNRESGGVVVLAHPRNSVRLTRQHAEVLIEVFIGHDPTID